MPSPRQSKNAFSHFEGAINKLDQIVQTLEKGQLPLEDALQNFEQGMQLAKEAHSLLTQAEQKVEKLVQKNGQLLTEPFETDDAESEYKD